MHRDLRIAVLTQAAYLLSARPRKGVVLQPVTDLAATAGDEGPVGSPAGPEQPYSMALLSATIEDLNVVGVDERALENTPLDELKRYREQHRSAYDVYRSELRACVQALATAPNATFAAAVRAERRADLIAASKQVRAINRSRWKATCSSRSAVLALSFHRSPDS